MKEEFITYNSQEEGAQQAMLDHMGRHQDWSGDRGVRRKQAPETIVVFAGRNGQSRVGKLSRFRIGEFE